MQMRAVGRRWLLLGSGVGCVPFSCRRALARPRHAPKQLTALKSCAGRLASAWRNCRGPLAVVSAGVPAAFSVPRLALP
eukprot:12930557-Prorocentrum_lima.AAC.1